MESPAGRRGCLRDEVVSTPISRRQAGAVVYCPACLHQFGGMTVCPWDNVPLLPIPADAEPPADPVAVAFYKAIA